MRIGTVTNHIIFSVDNKNARIRQAYGKVHPRTHRRGKDCREAILHAIHLYRSDRTRGDDHRVRLDGPQDEWSRPEHPRYNHCSSSRV